MSRLSLQLALLSAAVLFISSCAAEHHETTTVTTSAPETTSVSTTTTETGDAATHHINVQAPTSGAYNGTPNNGSTGAAKMIAPVTQ